MLTEQEQTWWEIAAAAPQENKPSAAVVMILLQRLEAEREKVRVLREALEAYDPPMPPMLEGETPEQYTDRLTGADRTGRVPYREHRNRQCSIGYHDECSDPEGVDCQCPCHQFERLRDKALVASASAGPEAAEKDARS